MSAPGNLISLAGAIALLLLSSPVDPGALLERPAPDPSPEPADIELEPPAIPVAMFVE
jgi:hypothetical protein